jgi:putative DNA primase/helicase
VDTEEDQPRFEIEFQPASEIKPKRVQWIWPNVIPEAELTVFGGLPGCGKSTVSMDIVASVTMGRDFPGGISNPNGPQDALLLVSEDDKATTVVPRLMAACADLTRVFFVTKVFIDQNMNRKEHPSIRLIVIDPITSYLGAAKKNDENDMRRIYDRLKDLAGEHNLALLLVDHFNKNTGQLAIHRFSGSQATTAVPRSVWMIAKESSDEHDEEIDACLLLCVKLNIVAKSKKKGRLYNIVTRNVDVEGKPEGVSAIEWTGTTNESADEFLKRQQQELTGDGAEDGKQMVARETLLAALENGPLPSKQVEEMAETEGISERTLNRARKALNIKSFKQGDAWYMRLPAMKPAVQNLTEETESEFL